MNKNSLYNHLLLNKSNGWLLIILLISVFLRFYHLTFQSLWLDELHTMLQAKPSGSFKDLYNFLLCCDQHPPLFYLTTKFLFSLFGHTEFVARSLAATTGTLCVLVLYFLGKELANNAVGLTAAAFLAINFYGISYSQEARMYMPALLFVIVSFLFLVKTFNQPNKFNAGLYGISALLMIYMHFSCLFVLVAQVVAITIFWWSVKESRLMLLKLLLPAFCIIMLLYLPALNILKQVSGIKSFWIQPVNSNFASEYFFEFFGNSGILVPFLILFLLFYFLRLQNIGQSNPQNSTPLEFIVLSSWIFITLLIPYFKSITSLPMLVPRYVITVLPAFLLMLAIGVQTISNKLIKGMVIGMFFLASLLDLFFVKKYYATITKTQFREATAYIASNNSLQLPIINLLTAWQTQYYTNKFNIGSQLIIENPGNLFDSFARSNNIKGFWLIGAHNSPPKLTDEQLKSLSANYIQTEDVNYFDAWVQQYVSINLLKDKFVPITFHPSLMFNMDKQNVIAIWGGKVSSEPINLTKGKYVLKLFSRGTPVKGEFPKIKISMNQNGLVEYTSKQELEQIDFPFETDGTPFQLSFEMMNDWSANGEDRNYFIQKAFVSKVE